MSAYLYSAIYIELLRTVEQGYFNKS